ncbi:MAG: tRNA pseudouridine(55) synthase TruB, partial [Lachnospiraceae bacterium]|nr:tRNA pseudouridine(55) synthase TruB [Lachnospiraceae bacterium]
MYNGILNVYKERGYTSFDVVAKLRGICGQKKIGHTGTLDPEAEGVLPVCLGKATKVCVMLTDRDKTYRAVMLLGVETDTLDTSGQVLRRSDTDGITEEAVREAIAGFVGETDQIPPMYSALKVNGQKLCDLARKGQTVERKPRRITIYEIRVESMNLPRVTMTVRCSKGTYIRSLCHDIGEKLGCHAALEHLLRTEAAGYRVEDALRLDEISALRDAGELKTRIRPVEDVFRQYPSIQTMEKEDRFLYNGNALREDRVSFAEGTAVTGRPKGERAVRTRAHGDTMPSKSVAGGKKESDQAAYGASGVQQDASSNAGKQKALSKTGKQEISVHAAQKDAW